LHECFVKYSGKESRSIVRFDTVTGGLNMAKILIADDQPNNREYLVNLLRHCGHDLLEAGDGFEALTRVQADHPDLVVADILMPKMDGDEFVRRMRGDPAIARTPVIFYSAAFEEAEMRTMAAACGVTHMLCKPAQPKAILDLVGSILGTPQRAVPDVQPLAEFDGELSRLLINKLSQRVESLEASNQRLNMLLKLATELGRERRPEPLLEHACHGARAILDAESTAIGVLDAAGRAFQYHVVSGASTEATSGSDTPEPHQGFFGEVLHTGRPLRGARHSLPFLGVPIASPSCILGVLYFTVKRGAEAFSEQDERLAVTIASVVATALENTKRHDTHSAPSHGTATAMPGLAISR
jgi:CheY-like chemotaxis protein